METKDKILQQAIFLFSQKGFAGVSMRNLAKAVDISAASLYHHFPDKNALYLQAMHQAFANKASGFNEVWQSPCSNQDKLRLFVVKLTELMMADRDFQRLMQRELLDADEQRMQALAQEVFAQQFEQLIHLNRQLAPEMDAHLLAVSIIGLVCYHLELRPLRRFLPEGRPEHDDVEIIAAHVFELLSHGLGC